MFDPNPLPHRAPSPHPGHPGSLFRPPRAQVEQKDRLIGEYEGALLDAVQGGGGSGSTGAGAAGAAGASSGTPSAMGSGGPERLRAVIQSYRREKEALSTQLSDWKARFQRFASEVETERSAQKEHLDRLRASAATADQASKQTADWTAERNRLKADLAAAKDDVDARTAEVRCVGAIFRTHFSGAAYSCPLCSLSPSHQANHAKVQMAAMAKQVDVFKAQAAASEQVRDGALYTRMPCVP